MSGSFANSRDLESQYILDRDEGASKRERERAKQQRHRFICSFTATTAASLVYAARAKFH